MTDLTGLLHAMASTRILIVGDVALDSYIEGDATRLCREAPVPVISVTERDDCPGSAANAAANVRALGGSAALITVLGDDPCGDALQRVLRAHDVNVDGVIRDPARRTLCFERITAHGQLVARVDDGTSAPLSPDAEARMVAAIEARWPESDAVVLSDYAHGVFTDSVIARIAELQAAAPHVVVVDAKQPARFRSIRPTAVKPNWEECLTLLPHDGNTSTRRDDRAAALEPVADTLLDAAGAQIVVVTLDEDGAMAFERDRAPHRTYSTQPTDGADQARTTGAGDTFSAALTLALTAGAHMPAAAELASAAAGVVVGRRRTSVCFAGELAARVAASHKRVDGASAISELVPLLRAQHRSIVFTNGVFDLLHRGHIAYLNRAKALGDVLIVGVNADATVRRAKGPSRPINPLDDRVQVLAALSCVDYVVPFDEPTPGRLLEAVRPDLYVKGGDYNAVTLPEAPLVERLGIRTEFLPFEPDRSTTSIIERIRSPELTA